MKKIYTIIAALLLWPLMNYAQNGDSCTVAVEITGSGTYTVDDMTGTGAAESNADAAAWFYYTPTENGTIEVSSCVGGGGVDTRVHVREGDCSSLSLIDSDDDACDAPNGLASIVSDISVLTGNTYYIEWDDRWSATGFDFDFTFTPLPGPDSCQVAIEVFPGTYLADVLEGGGGSGGGDAAWYTYTAPDNGFIDVSSCYGGTDTRLFIWSGDCDNLVAVDDTDDDCPYAADSTGSSYAASLEMVPVDSGVTYYIEWTDQWSNNAFFWSLSFATPGSTCGLATEVLAPSATTTPMLTGDGGTNGGSSAWYSYTALMDGSINVSSCYGGADTRLFIWEGTCDALVAVADTDDDCIYATDSTGSSYAASLEGVNVTAGTTYYIEWDDQWGTSGFNWTLEFSEVVIIVPVNDTCGGAQITDVTVGTMATAFGDGTNATADPGFPVAEVWEAFTISECADVTIDFCGSVPMAVTLYINLFDACPIGASLPTGTVTFIECAGNDSAQSIFFPNVDAGTYWYPVLADSANYNGFTNYTINYTATACEVGQPDTCDVFLGGPYTNFNTAFGGAPVADADGNCPVNEITDFEVWASESYTVDGFTNGEEYTFSICNGYGAWDAELSVWDENGDLVAMVEGCEITWTATYDGTYVIGINEVGACGSTSDNTTVDNGFPSLTCEGTVGINDIEMADFAIYPNPNNGEFSIVNEGVDGNYLIELIDVTGKVVYSEQLHLNANDRSVINSTDVNTGVYLVKLTNTEANYYRTLRMVIK